MQENDIKTAFLPFLREFYRFRYEYQAHTEQVSLDNVSNEGIIADGMLKFAKPDGSPFVCTYEATSADKSEEVKFSQNQDYFLWDCIAFSAFVAMVVYVFLFATDLVFIGKMPLTGKIGLPLGIALIAFFLWYFMMPAWKKYRYIYALEQFKRYYADEQWVALADDVFPSPINPYFLELKDQCIYQGVGLAIVYPDKQVRLVAAPSRLGVYGGNRRMAHWLTDTQIFQSMASNTKAAAAYQPPVVGGLGKLWRTLTRPVLQYVFQPLQRAVGRSAQPATDFYRRFTGDFLVQKWVTLLSCLVMLYIGVNATEKAPFEIADRPSRLYVPDEKAPPPSPERQDGYVMNDREQAIPYGSTYRTDQRSGVPRQDERGADYSNASSLPPDYEGDEEIGAEQAKNAASSPKNIDKTDKPVLKPVAKPAARPKSICERMKAAGGWYVQDNVFASAENAQARAELLRSKKIACDAVNLSCMGEEIWVVRLGYNQYTEAAARTKATEMSKAIAAAGLKTGKILVKKVEK
jgi:cell division septation protein DedD